MSPITLHPWGQTEGRGEPSPLLMAASPLAHTRSGDIFSSYEEGKTNKHPDPPPRSHCQQRNKTLQQRALK